MDGCEILHLGWLKLYNGMWISPGDSDFFHPIIAWKKGKMSEKCPTPMDWFRRHHRKPVARTARAPSNLDLRRRCTSNSPETWRKFMLGMEETGIFCMIYTVSSWTYWKSANTVSSWTYWKSANYLKNTHLVRWFTKDGDFPVRYVNVYQSVT